MDASHHATLPSGIEYALADLSDRHVVAMQIRMLAGIVNEPAEKPGLARLLSETLDKGTAKRSGRELSDAFDALGAARGHGCGRETTTFTCAVLPEHFEKVVELHAEMIRTPSFPEDAFKVNVDLTHQELDALDDDPQALVDKYISQQAYGPVLGRHPLGESEKLDQLRRDDLVEHWRSQFCGGRMLVSIAGPVNKARVEDVLGRHFGDFGSAERAGRDVIQPIFTAGTRHYDKALEQEQIGICWPGVDATHDDFPIQQVTLGILSGGMGARLFTEVREKQGLVYWVGAWQDTPRGSGMIFLGASTTPERCDRTYATLLREVDRLAEDVTQEELDRAVVGIVAQRATRGDSTRAKCSELCNDLFFYGRPVPEQEKLDKVRAVTLDDIRRYLGDYPRDRLCVVTLGPRPLSTVNPASAGQGAAG